MSSWAWFLLGMYIGNLWWMVPAGFIVGLVVYDLFKQAKKERNG